MEYHYNRWLETGSRPNILYFTQFLASFPQKYKISPYIVFDAVDECSDENKNGILQLLLELQSVGYRLLISSRSHFQQLLSAFHNASHITIAADYADLRNYIASRLETKGIKDTKFRSKCLNLAEGVHGM